MIDRGSMITEESIKIEIEELETQIKNYKAMYVLIGCYCSLYRLFFSSYGISLLKKHKTGSFEDQMIITAKSVAIFNLPWMLKPIFGYIGDVFSPFGYRATGYIRIITMCNALILLGYIRYGDSDNIIWYLFTYVGLSSFLDSIAQGMTTIVVTMELRLEEKKNPLVEFRTKEGSDIMEVDRLEEVNESSNGIGKNRVWEPSLVKNFVVYVAATYASYCLWLFVGFYFSLLNLKKQAQGIVISSSESDIKNVSIFCAGASVVLFLCTFFLSELKRTSWWSPNIRKKPFKVVLIGIFRSRDTILIYTLCLLSINPSNYFWEFTYRFFVLNSIEAHKVESIVFLSSPILFSGLSSFLLLMYIIKVWKYKKTFWYLKMIALMSLVNLTNHYLMSICNGQTWMKSEIMLYLYAIGGFIGLDVVSAITKVCLIDKFLLKSPKGYEVFYINMVLSLISVTRGIGKLVSSMQSAYFKLDTSIPSSIRVTVYFNWVMVVAPLVLYWLYKPKKKSGLKAELQEEVQTEYDLLHSSYNLEDWKQINHEDALCRPTTLKRTMSTGDTISSRR